MRFERHHQWILRAGLLVCCACGSSDRNEPAGKELTAGEAGNGAAPSDATDDEVVQCGGQVCQIPDLGSGLDERPCCVGTQCGVHVVGSSVVADICIPFMSDGEPNTDCSPSFDRMLFVFRYGCCLPDGHCGELEWGDQGFGCVDPRVIGLPAGATCDLQNTCKKHDSPCTEAAECCSFEPLGTSCVDLGAGKVCAMNCAQDNDCPTLCCRPQPGGVQTCVPPEMCNTP